MKFEDINERASIRRVGQESSHFRFEYFNDFYGSCQFVAEVVEFENRPLRFDEDSLYLESHTIKRGSATGLLNTAKSFFRRVLGKYTDLKQLEKDSPSRI